MNRFGVSAPRARPQKTGVPQRRDSRHQLEWIAQGFTAVSFWTAPDRSSSGLEDRFRFWPMVRTGNGPIESEACPAIASERRRMFSRNSPPPPRLWRGRPCPSCQAKSSRSSRPEDARRKEKTFRKGMLFSVDRPGLIGVSRFHLVFGLKINLHNKLTNTPNTTQ
jgi:hypothetical protein